MSILGIICTLSMFLFGEPLIALFAPNNPELISLTAKATNLYSISFLINGINILGSAYFIPCIFSNVLIKI